MNELYTADSFSMEEDDFEIFSQQVKNIFRMDISVAWYDKRDARILQTFKKYSAH